MMVPQLNIALVCPLKNRKGRCKFILSFFVVRKATGRTSKYNQLNVGFESRILAVLNRILFCRFDRCYMNGDTIV